MPKKPSKMKKIGKARAKPGAQAKKAASKLGGYSGKAASAITKRNKQMKKALKGS